MSADDSDDDNEKEIPVSSVSTSNKVMEVGPSTDDDKAISPNSKESDLPELEVEPQPEPLPVTDFSDPALWPLMDNKIRDSIIRNPPPQQEISSMNFKISLQLYGPKEKRKATSSMFFSNLKNGELKRREWLLYSNSAGKCFCFPCSLFHQKQNPVRSGFIIGFNDWKHENRILEHGRSLEHRLNVTHFVTRANTLGKIDS